MQQDDSNQWSMTSESWVVTEGHWHTCLSRTKQQTLCEAGTVKDLSTQGNQLDTGSVGSELLLRDCSDPRSILMWQRGGQKTTHSCAVFQQVNVEKCGQLLVSWSCYSFNFHHVFPITLSVLFYNYPNILSHLLKGCKSFFPSLKSTSN